MREAHYESFTCASSYRGESKVEAFNKCTKMLHVKNCGFFCVQIV